MMKPCQMIAVICLFYFLNSLPASAIELRFPVACTLFENCWITNHVDLDKSLNQTSDYMCGEKATDNNKSTHISLGNINAVNDNIAVVAAADGIIEFAGSTNGLCGERILIKHNKGWQTSYCHLKPETLHVTSGQRIKAGQILGAVGMSGRTDWPKLSFAVIRNDLIFDPMSGRTSLEGCGPKPKPLWIGGKNPLYEPANVTMIGFTVGDLTNQQIQSGLLNHAVKISTKTPQLVLYGMMMNVLKGDDIILKVTEPSNRTLREIKIKAKETKRYYPIYLSILRKNLLWDMGQYKGEITITRNVHGNKITVGKFTTTIIE